jgi:hypothetical protein
MKRSISLLIFVLVLFGTSSSKPILGEESLESVFKRIKEEVDANSKAYTSLEKACATIGHRLTGSAHGKKAEEFAFKLFKEYGLNGQIYIFYY